MRVIFTKDQYNFLLKAFPETVIQPDDVCIVNKLLVREGVRKVIQLIKEHSEAYERSLLNRKI